MIRKYSKGVRQKVLEQLKLLDRNGGGKITSEELSRFLQILLKDTPEAWTHDQIERLVSSMDCDGSKSVDLQEFTNFIFTGSVDAEDYLSVESLLEAASTGEVCLLRATWLLQYAGYERVQLQKKVLAGPQLGDFDFYWDQTHGYEKQEKPLLALPRRQDIEREHPAAIMSADALADYVQQHRTLIAAAKCKFRLAGVVHVATEYAPISSVSHCWETSEHPDPRGTTLARVVEVLAAELPMWEAWGLRDMAVFFDFASLYQQPRTEREEKLFRQALSRMSLWYAHRLVTVLVVREQECLQCPREKRGWPTYESCCSRLFKVKTGSENMVLECGDTVMPRQTSKVKQLLCRPGTENHDLDPPEPPSRFEEDLQTKQFTNGADRTIVAKLYSSVVQDGFSQLTDMTFSKLNWGNAEMTLLAQTMMEAPCHRLLKLELDQMPFTVDGLLQLAAAAAAARMPALQKLSITRCENLTGLPAGLCVPTLRELCLGYCQCFHTLPEDLGCCVHLETIDLTAATDLRKLPESIGGCINLQHLNLWRCYNLEELPSNLSKCRELKELELGNCEHLWQLPDMSCLTCLTLQQDSRRSLPHLEIWKENGFKAMRFMELDGEIVPC